MTVRVTQNLLNNVVLSNLNRSVQALLNLQSHLSSGKRITRPSDDPVGTSNAMRLRTQMSQSTQYLRNIDQGDTQLTMADSVFEDITNLLTRAQDLAISQANVTADTRTRSAVAEEVNALIDQFIDLLNTRVGGRYLFSGFETLDAPYVQSENGVTYRGDSGELNIEVDSGTTVNPNVPGSTLIPSVEDDLGGHANLFAFAERDLSLPRRNLTEMNKGTGVDPGFIRITNRAGNSGLVDLRNVTTLEEAAFRISNSFDLNGNKLAVEARIDENLQALVVEDKTSINDRLPGQQLVVEDIANGRTARQLGILGDASAASGVITGRNLAAVSLTTRLDDLNYGSGVETGKFRIEDRAGNSGIVDITGAVTITDVRDLINAAGTNLSAQINTGGNGILLVDGTPPERVTGVIKISEFGEGTNTARDLGLLTPESGVTGNVFFSQTVDPRLTLDTPVSLLNRAQGFDLKFVHVENGPLSGDIDLSRAATVGGILKAFNEAGLNLAARINDLGTGISITSTVGGRTLKITDGPGGYAATQLGITGSRTILVDPIKPLGAESDLLPALDGETRLSQLNRGAGIGSGVFRITDGEGNSVNINISGVNTVQGVLNIINEVGFRGAGLVKVEAALSPDQKGISIIDKSTPSTVIEKTTPQGVQTGVFGDLKTGNQVLVNALQSVGQTQATYLSILEPPEANESGITGLIDSIDKETGRISLRAADGTLYDVISEQPIQNFFIGQNLYLNGEVNPTGQFVARTVTLVQGAGTGEETLVGKVQSIDSLNSRAILQLEDGSTREIDLVTGRQLVKVEDLGEGRAAFDLGLRGVAVAGSDRILGGALDPLIAGNTRLSLLNGGTFIPGKINIQNGDRNVVIDLSSAVTIEDVITRINTSTAGVVATINSAGTGLEFKSRIAGTTMVVNNIIQKNPDGTNMLHPDGTTLFDTTAELLGLTGSQDVIGNLLFLRTALLNNSQTDIQKTLSKFSDAMNRVLNQRTKIGARTNQLNTTHDRSLDTNLRNTDILSGIEDLDVIEAVSNLAAQENAYNAALGAASKIILPSLLDFL